MEFLVVEDDAVSQVLAAGMLKALGYAVRVADDGAAAIESCLAQAPEAVLMDVQMPRMDGLETTRELRRLQADERLPWFPIIVASAFYTPADRAACFEAGVDGFVTKPLMLAKLGAEVFRVAQRTRRPPPHAGMR
ncbi:response regulator [Aquabacterium sp. A7-Y]|uniref:response regulator n=1 Tax=Aquabacterium sp. A7-Y TaxID=1349605 RepID=UPI00223E0EF1|nr:response regulator [Aquabacterium sp. A7-Y]MCW7539243.1 response regulator [Aquabacterium sp. A7-Y]